MTTPKEAGVLLDHFKKIYKEKYGKSPKVNTYSDKWGMIDTIDDHGFDKTRELLDYYISTGSDWHSIKDFYRRADVYRESMEAGKRDRMYRERLMQQTKERVEQEKGE